jgi:hypothetical protein
LPKDALNIDEFDEQHKVDCYFDHSLTLKLVEFFLLAEKFLPQAEVRRAELGKLAFIQKSKDSLDSEPLPFELISQALDRTSPHAPLCTLILDYVPFDYLDKNSFMTRIRDELLEAFKDRQTNNDCQKETRHHNPEQIEESVAKVKAYQRGYLEECTQADYFSQGNRLDRRRRWIQQQICAHRLKKATKLPEDGHVKGHL